MNSTNHCTILRVRYKIMMWEVFWFVPPLVTLWDTLLTNEVKKLSNKLFGARRQFGISCPMPPPSYVPGWPLSVRAYYWKGNFTGFHVKQSKIYEPISVSLSLSQTPSYSARQWIQSQWIAWCACLLSNFHWYSLCLPTEGWPTHPQMITHPSTSINLAWCWATMLIKTNALS